MEQVSFAFSKSELMVPFRPLMKKGAEYIWIPELQGAFDLVGREIVELVKSEVRSFQLGAWTCVVMDWICLGIGLVPWQKPCQSPQFNPTCCKSGWVVVTCGSRFFTPADATHHSIEGELFGVVWALDKTRI